MATIRRPRKKKSEQVAELVVPEIVEEKLWSLSEWVEAHWKPVLGTIGGVTLLWGSIGIIGLIMDARANSRADATSAAFLLASRPVVPPQEEPKPAEGEDAAKEEGAKKKAPPPKESFDTEQARAAAVLAAAKPADDATAPWVNLLVGNAKAVSGDYAAQLAAVDAALAQAAGQALELPLRQQRAVALAGLGRSADAVAEWTKVAQLSAWPFDKALAQLRTGDLYNPALGSKSPDAGKAKTAYEQARLLARPGDKDPAPGALAWVAADARAKLAGL